MRTILTVVVMLIATACSDDALPVGASCATGSECATGFCVAFGCETQGVCIDPASTEECSPDADHYGFVPACTCDGEQLERIRPLCPSSPIMGYGSCEYVLAH